MTRNIVLFTAICALLTISCKKDGSKNKLPIVDAGPSKTITLDVDSVTLDGSATDEDGQVVAYQWGQVSGPAAATIANPFNATTKIKGLKQGSYTFQLLATDNKGATAEDTVVVTVNPSPLITLTLQPANNPNEIIIINHNGTPLTGSGSPELSISAWTSGGVPWTVRGIIKFDLSSIPASAVITSANLYLYSLPAPMQNGNLINANFGTANAMLVQQVTSNWVLPGMNWFNLPTVATNNQILVPHTTESAVDLNLDVTNMVSSMVSNNTNYGFYFKMQDETYYKSRIFVASYNTTHTTKIPKLVVVYQ